MQNKKPLSVHTFDRWCRTLDEALSVLPEHSDWSNDLYRSLVHAYRDKDLRILLWTERDAPIGLSAFYCDRKTVWQPVTQWLLPGFFGPIRCERLDDLLRSLPLSAHVAWWRMDGALPPVGGRLHAVHRETTYGLVCNKPFEDHWRSTGILKDIRRSRNRCTPLDLEHNAPGAAEWVIRNCEQYWSGGMTRQFEAKLEVARQLQAQNKLFTVSLADAGRFVGAEVVLVHRNDAVCYLTFRNRDRHYAKLGVGNFLLAQVFEHAKALELDTVDLGGGYDYKAKWARPMDVKATLVIRPLLQRLWHSSLTTVRSFSRPIYTLSGRAFASRLLSS